MIDYKKKYLKYKQKYLNLQKKILSNYKLKIKGGFLKKNIKISKNGLIDTTAPYIDDTFTCKKQKNIIICKDIKTEATAIENETDIKEFVCTNRDNLTYEEFKVIKEKALAEVSNYFVIPPLNKGNNNKKLLIYTDHLWGAFIQTERILHFPGHIIQIRDIENKWFSNFIKGPVKKLKKYITTHNIEEITILGFSMGGTGALYYSKYFKDAICISINPQIINKWSDSIYSFHKTHKWDFYKNILDIPYNIRKHLATTKTKTYILVDIGENTLEYWGDNLHAGKVPKNENINIIQFDIIGHSELIQILFPKILPSININNYLINLINLKHTDLKIDKTLIENVELNSNSIENKWFIKEKKFF